MVPTTNSIGTLRTAQLEVHHDRPYHRNYNKRLVKSPKVYFVDTGLACHLLGVSDERQLVTHPRAERCSRTTSSPK